MQARAAKAAKAQPVGVGPYRSMMIKQEIDAIKIRSVSDGSAWGWGPHAV
jgi:hypothetical protein